MRALRTRGRSRRAAGFASTSSTGPILAPPSDAIIPGESLKGWITVDGTDGFLPKGLSDQDGEERLRVEFEGRRVWAVGVGVGDHLNGPQRWERCDVQTMAGRPLPTTRRPTLLDGVDPPFVVEPRVAVRDHAGDACDE